MFKMIAVYGLFTVCLCCVCVSASAYCALIVISFVFVFGSYGVKRVWCVIVSLVFVVCCV